MTDLAWDGHGDGAPVLLLHAGVADRRMWEPVLPALAASYRVLRCDLRGYGDSPQPTGDWFDHEDVLGVLDAAGVERVAVVGASNGGRVAADLAVEAADRVAALVLVGAALPGAPVPDDLADAWEEEERLIAEGDVEGAVEVNLRLWVDGTGRDGPPVDPALREQLASWFRDVLSREAAERDAEGEPQGVEPPLAERLGDIAAPTLVVVGAHDHPRFRLIAQRYVERISGARLAVVDDAAHLVSVERPAELTHLVRDFLARCGWS